MVSCKMIVMRS